MLSVKDKVVYRGRRAVVDSIPARGKKAKIIFPDFQILTVPIADLEPWVEPLPDQLPLLDVSQFAREDERRSGFTDWEVDTDGDDQVDRNLSVLPGDRPAVDPNSIDPNLSIDLDRAVDPNLVDPNFLDPNSSIDLDRPAVDPNSIDPNLSIDLDRAVDPNSVDPNLSIEGDRAVDPNSIDPNSIDPNSIDPNLSIEIDRPVDPNSVDLNLDPNSVDPNLSIEIDRPVDPNSVDPNSVDPNFVDPNFVDPNSVDPNSVDPNSVDPNLLIEGDRSNHRSKGYEEIKTIKGQQYRYWRYYEGGRKRSKYLGKVGA